LLAAGVNDVEISKRIGLGLNRTADGAREIGTDLSGLESWARDLFGE
jgi:hypothetical protein